MLRVRFGSRPMVFVLAIAVAMLADDSAQAQGRRGGRGGFGRRPDSMLSLAQIEKVQEELKITDEQREEIEKISATYGEDMQELMSGLQDLSREERSKKMAEMAPERDKITAEAEKQLAGVLKEDQVKRLRGITIQALGPNALLRADVAEALKLTDDQSKQIKEIVGSEMTRMTPSPGDRAGAEGKGKKDGDGDGEKKGRKKRGGGGDFSQIRERMAEARKQTEAEVAKVLTPEQQQQLADLKGPAFEIPAPQRGGGRFRGGDKKAE